MKVRLLILFTSLVLLHSFLIVSACSTGNNNETSSNCKTIELDQFTVTDLSGKGRLVTDDVDIMGVVSSLEVTDNGYIAICQNRQDAHVILYNSRTDSSETVMTRGEGPMEMLRVSTMSSDSDGNLWLVGLMDKKVMKVNCNADGSDASVEAVFRLPEDCLRGVTDGEGGIIALHGGNRQSRLIQLDADAHIIDSMGNYPNTKMPDGVCPTNFIFQSDMAFSPDVDKVAIACKSWNYIDIVDRQTKETIGLTLPIDAPIELKSFEAGGAVSYNPAPFWLMFSDVEATRESFFVGYIGAKVESPSDLDKQINSILEFDWDGNPLKILKFSNDVVTFSVSKDGKTLYTVENAPDPALFEYQLN